MRHNNRSENFEKYSFFRSLDGIKRKLYSQQVDCDGKTNAKCHLGDNNIRNFHNYHGIHSLNYKITEKKSNRETGKKRNKCKNIQLSFASAVAIMSTIFASYCWSIRLSNSFDIRFPKTESKQIKLNKNKLNFYRNDYFSPKKKN